ncbi:MAG: DnaA N-terminal domain-containing protein, partial [Haemophilus parainfluenzae]|nr:DnaA N-terminal domain-containing protein [Haemophilus parainfluenzae]
MSLSTLWQDCLSQLQDQVSPMDLSTWLRPLQADVISQDQVVLY